MIRATLSYLSIIAQRKALDEWSAHILSRVRAKQLRRRWISKLHAPGVERNPSNAWFTSKADASSIALREQTPPGIVSEALAFAVRMRGPALHSRRRTPWVLTPGLHLLVNRASELSVTGKLSAKLVPRLRSRFAGRGLRLHKGLRPVASFPAVHPEVGDLTICDDDEEVTVYIGQLTHGHFSSPPIDDALPVDIREEKIIDRVIGFLDAVFDDEIEFSREARNIGGWRARRETNPLTQGDQVRRFVWSGPIESGE